MTGIILRKLVDPLGKFKLLNLFLESGAFLDTSNGRLVTALSAQNLRPTADSIAAPLRRRPLPALLPGRMPHRRCRQGQLRWKCGINLARQLLKKTKKMRDDSHPKVAPHLLSSPVLLKRKVCDQSRRDQAVAHLPGLLVLQAEGSAHLVRRVELHHHHHRCCQRRENSK